MDLGIKELQAVVIAGSVLLHRLEESWLSLAFLSELVPDFSS